MTDFKWQSGDFSPIAIIAMKNIVMTYLKWREEGQDANGKAITPEATAAYETACQILNDIGEKM